MRLALWILWTVAFLVLQIADGIHAGHNYYGLTSVNTGMRHNFIEQRTRQIPMDPYNRGLWNRVPMSSLESRDRMYHFSHVH
ncbi:unnamed protein product [Echinostoma caproni]|uniref:Secreted protein n=1 Tax=Echinostoma caproni TaxID=27848 RepID=A0A183AH31_9TREM|nr:unnamed protein product [Echinostoma caproni]